MFIDTHVHFDNFVEDGSLETILENAEHSKVRKMLAVGGSMAANELSLRLAQEFPGRIFGSVGYDRDLAGEELDVALLREQAARPEVVAIGETGLDYFYEPEKSAAQKELFFQCLEIANEAGKPVIVHTRDADDDTLGMLTDLSRVWKNDPARIGIIHCYTRDGKMARALLDLGFMISFSGIVTFRNADPLREVAKMVPLDRMLIETDSPYLAPVPHRGKRCEPAFVADTAALLADLRGITVEALAEQTSRNAHELFFNIK
jgi:TatD DNase family protein